jgi:hypothetical protein
LTGITDEGVVQLVCQYVIIIINNISVFDPTALPRLHRMQVQLQDVQVAESESFHFSQTRF